MTIDQAQEQIVEEFSVFADWMEKYTYLIDLSKELKDFKEEYRDGKNLIKGCQSQVWLQDEYKDGSCRSMRKSCRLTVVYRR